jgi:hypothetical protein
MLCVLARLAELPFHPFRPERSFGRYGTAEAGEFVIKKNRKKMSPDSQATLDGEQSR